MGKTVSSLHLDYNNTPRPFFVPGEDYIINKVY